MTSRATLVLANHRPETVSPAMQLMARHDAIILEEPPDPRFLSMLSGHLAIDVYLEDQDLEYPEFSRRMAEGLRGLYRSGIHMYQVEPFIGHLIDIHKRFADGQRPSDLPAGTDLERVYRAERSATAALIDFYEVSIKGSLDDTVAAVKRFARADAERFVLRDRLRAQAIADVLTHCKRTYIEAGQIHYPLWRDLRQRLPAGYPLKVHFLMSEVVRSMGDNGHLFGPGDLLTLLYRFHPRRRFSREDLLAARALIYSKLILKQEMDGTGTSSPHTRDEIAVEKITARLSLADCQRLYPHLRRAPTKTAREMVGHYLARMAVTRPPGFSVGRESPQNRLPGHSSGLSSASNVNANFWRNRRAGALC
ncbi:MAG: hypothetical protein WAM61_14055 [Desulfobacterales bacterium]